MGENEPRTGSRVVTEYFDKAGLSKDLDALGFQTVGYGCTTCIGNSGPAAGAGFASRGRGEPRGFGRPLGGIAISKDASIRR